METIIAFIYAITIIAGLILLIQWANKSRPINNKEDKVDELQNGDIVVKLFDDNLYYKCTVRKSFGVTFYDRIEYPYYFYQEGGSSSGSCSTYYHFITGINTTSPIGFISTEDCMSYKSNYMVKDYLGYRYRNVMQYWFVDNDYYKANYYDPTKKIDNGTKIFNKHYSEEECIDWIERDIASKKEKEQRSKVIKL